MKQQRRDRLTSLRELPREVLEAARDAEQKAPRPRVILIQLIEAELKLRETSSSTIH